MTTCIYVESSRKLRDSKKCWHMSACAVRLGEKIMISPKCVCVCVCIYIYIYIYRERERERERDTHTHTHTMYVFYLSFYLSASDLLSFIISNTNEHEFNCISKWISCCYDVMNHVDCVIKRDVYLQKMHSCSKNIRGRSVFVLKISIVY